MPKKPTPQQLATAIEVLQAAGAKVQDRATTIVITLKK